MPNGDTDGLSETVRRLTAGRTVLHRLKPHAGSLLHWQGTDWRVEEVDTIRCRVTLQHPHTHQKRTVDARDLHTAKTILQP